MRFLCLMVEIDGKWAKHCIWLDGKHNRILLESYARKLDKPTRIESYEENTEKLQQHIKKY